MLVESCQALRTSQILALIFCFCMVSSLQRPSPEVEEGAFHPSGQCIDHQCEDGVLSAKYYTTNHNMP